MQHLLTKLVISLMMSHLLAYIPAPAVWGETEAKIVDPRHPSHILLLFISSYKCLFAVSVKNKLFFLIPCNVDDFKAFS